MDCNILCVDKYDIIRLEFSRLLGGYGINFINAGNEVDAVNILSNGKIKFNAVLWDINADNYEDLDLISRLKNKEYCRNIPIIIVSGLTDRKHIIKAIESGAVEYIVKPYDEEIVEAKICGMLNMSCRGKAADKDADDNIVYFSFSEMFNKEIKAADRGGYPLSAMIISLIPESSAEPGGEFYGNVVTDIITLADRVIRTRLRETDTLFQYGINSLVILLPFTNKRGAEPVEAKIRSLFENHTLIKQKGGGFSFKLITASVTFPEDGKTKNKLLEKLKSEFMLRLKENNAKPL